MDGGQNQFPCCCNLGISQSGAMVVFGRLEGDVGSEVVIWEIFLQSSGPLTHP